MQYAFSGDMRFNTIKWEQKGTVTRKYDATREKGGDNFKKSNFKDLNPEALER